MSRWIFNNNTLYNFNSYCKVEKRKEKLFFYQNFDNTPDVLFYENASDCERMFINLTEELVLHPMRQVIKQKDDNWREFKEKEKKEKEKEEAKIHYATFIKQLEGRLFDSEMIEWLVSYVTTRHDHKKPISGRTVMMLKRLIDQLEERSK